MGRRRVEDATSCWRWGAETAESAEWGFPLWVGCYFTAEALRRGENKKKKWGRVG